MFGPEDFELTRFDGSRLWSDSKSGPIESIQLVPNVTDHMNLASICCDIGKQCRTKSEYAASDQVLHCLAINCSIKIWIKMKNTTQQPLNLFL